MRRILVLILCLGLVGCSTYYSFILPEDHSSEAGEILNKFNRQLNLKNKYTLKILTKDEMDKIISSGIPHIEKNTIYIDEPYLQYLYAQSNGKYYHIRKRDLACIFAHEICHIEYDLPNTPIDVHYQVDREAIEMLKNFDINWQNYMGAMARLENYIKTRKGDFVAFGKNLGFFVTALGAGFYFDIDIWNRNMMIYNDYSKEYTYREALQRVKYDFSRKDDWNFSEPLDRWKQEMERK